MEPEGKKRKYSFDADSSHNDNISNQASAPQGNISEIRQRAQKYLLPLAPDQILHLLLDICETIPAAFEIVEERAAQDPVHRKLFVRGLSWDTTDETLRSVFEKYGTIEEAAVVRDRVTDKSKGYGFVIFDDMDAANAALQQPVKEIDGRSTRCNLAALRDMPPSGGAGHHAMMPPMMNMPPMMSMPPMGGAAGGGGDLMSQVGATDPEAPEMRRLFIRGLDYNTEQATVRSIFERYGDIEDLAIATDKHTGRSKGFAFLTFRRAASAAEALQTPTRDIDGRTVSVHLAALRQNQGGRGGGGRGGGHMMDGGMFPPYGGRGGPMMGGGFMPPGGPGFFVPPYGGGGRWNDF